MSHAASAYKPKPSLPEGLAELVCMRLQEPVELVHMRLQHLINLDVANINVLKHGLVSQPAGSLFWFLTVKPAGSLFFFNLIFFRIQR